MSTRIRGRRVTAWKPTALPEFSPGAVPGWRWARRATGVSLAILGLLGVLALVLALTMSLRATVRGGGVLEPVDVWPVRVESGGRIARVLVSAGDSVRAGQAVARIDDTDLRAEVERLEAQSAVRSAEVDRLARAMPFERARLQAAAEAAEGRLILAEAELRERMAAFGVRSSLDSVVAAARLGRHVALDRAAAGVVEARAAVRSAHVAIAALEITSFDVAAKRAEIVVAQQDARHARARMARTTVRAPANGVVLTRVERALGGSLVREGDVILDVADLRRWQVRLEVAQGDARRIRRGDPAEIRVAALGRPGEAMRGHVVEVGLQTLGSGRAASGLEAPSGRVEVLLAVDLSPAEPSVVGMLRRGLLAECVVVTRRMPARELLREYVAGRS